MKTPIILLVAPLLMAAGPAMDAETRDDVRCFAALMTATDSEDDDQVTAITIVSQYYLGRIDARMPGLDLEEAISAEILTMDEDDIGDLLLRCSKQVEDRGQYLIDMGERLEQRGKEPAPTT